MEIKMSAIPGKNPGKVGKISVKVGDKVQKGDVLAQVETGKGNRVIKAENSGTIKKIYYEEGSPIKSNDLLFEIDEDESSLSELIGVKMSAIPGKNPGKVGKISVKVGDKVQKGDVLAQVETGKGNRVIKSENPGTIKKIYFEEGSSIKSNDLIFDLETSKEKEGEEAKDTMEISKIKMFIVPGNKKTLVESLSVKVGDTVEKGQVLGEISIEGSGKRAVKSNKKGTVKSIGFNEGEAVSFNDVLFEIEYDKNALKEENLDTDILIIGAGPGGYVAAIYAAKKGKKVTIVEKNSLGGTCLNVGCIPTKALVSSAHIYNNIKNAQEFGIEISSDAKPNMEKIIDRKKGITNKLVDGIKYLMDKNSVEVLEGEAYFISDDKVQVKGKKLWNVNAKDIIIATGSKISSIPIPGLDLPMVLNSTDALSLRQLPKSITIIGGGVIGMEFAFIYSSLGVKVNVVEFMPELLSMVDIEVSKEIKSLAVDFGINVYTSSKVKKVMQDKDENAVVFFENQGNEEILVSEKVLVAIGREPNLDGLKLENTTIQLNDNSRGIKVDSHMKTSKEHVYAIGDVTNIIQLAHVASHQGIVAVENILGENVEMNYEAVPNVIFTMPEIASVGLNEQQCKEKNIDYKVSRFDYQGNGKALTLGETQGFIKLIADKKTDVILGATIIGADASALISTLTVAVKNKFTSNDISNTIFAHPTTSEVIHEAALGLGIGALHQ